MSDQPSEKSERLYSLPIRKPVTTAMVFVTLIVFGWKSFQDLPVNLMPDISYPTLTVRTEYEGAAPEDVEKLVTRPIEETLSIVSGLVEISSNSSPGVSEIVLEFNWGTDMNVSQQDVRDRLDLFDPPREVTKKPVILRFDPTLDPVFRVALTGEDFSNIQDPVERDRLGRQQLTEIREAAERYVKTDLEAEPGIAQVTVKGGREEEVQIQVDAERLKNLGLSVEGVADQLRQQNINLSGGKLREGKTEYLVRTRNEWQDIQEIPNSIISTPTGQQIRLANVATIKIGEKERASLVRVNGIEGVELEIYKWGDANTVRVCSRLKDLFGFEREKNSLERLTGWFEQWSNKPPSGVSVPPQLAMMMMQKQMGEKTTLMSRLPDYVTPHLVSDQSRFILAAIHEVQGTAVYGGILAIAVVYFFLWELKSTVIISISIPISIIATFVPMFVQNCTLNIMSLGGLAMGIGKLVDDSIVVLESVHRCREEGDERVDAADRGRYEVAAPVISSTLTSVAVFLPIAFVEGVAGQMFHDHALTVTYSLLASLLVALYLVPMIASRAGFDMSSKAQVIWVLNARRRAEREGAARGQSYLMMLPYAALGAAEWLVEQLGVTFSPLISWVKAPLEHNPGSSVVFVFRAVVSVVPLILLGILFSVQCMLALLREVFTTALLVFSVCLMGFLWVFGKAFNIVFWVPLWVFNKGFEAFRSGYVVFMHHAMRFSPAVLAIVAVLFIHSASLLPRFGRELIPDVKQGEFGIRLDTPAGTRLDETERRAHEIEKLAITMPEIEMVAVEIGKENDRTETDRGENVADISLTIKNPKANAARQGEIMERLREAVDKQLLASDQVTFTLPALFSFKTAVELQIRGDDFRELQRVGRETVEAIQGVPGVKDAELNMREGYPEIIIELDRDLLAAKGIPPEVVALRLRTELQGDLPTEFSRQGKKIDVRVQADKALLSTVDDLKKLSVSAGYPPVPLESVAHISVRPGPNEIRRVDQRQVAIVTANVQGRDLGAVMEDIKNRTKTVQLPADFEIIAGGQNRELGTAYSSLKFALILALFLVYAVMACQFESLLDPALVMFTIPLASIGVVYTLAAMSISLSILVYIGAISLMGIVVNNAILLVDYINLLMSRGMPKREAIIEAGRIRMRPIFMTAATTVLGLLPMAIATGEGGEIRRPMAITIMSGLTFATILTLVIIPMVFDLLKRERHT